MENTLLLALLKCKNIGTAKTLKFIKENKYNVENIKNNLKLFINEEDFINWDSKYITAENEIKTNKSLGIDLISIFDKNFPTKLSEINDPILYLYYKGNISLINTPSITIIGTRKPSEISQNLALKCGEIFGYTNTVVSGLALGVDTLAHKGCLNVKGNTIAVMPSDLNNIAPSSNKLLANDILKNNGCLISEYSVGMKIDKFNYVKRDRIQSALSNVILVVEANEKSGTMIAVNYAKKYDKKVYALDHFTNDLIKEKVSINNNVDVNTIKHLINENKSVYKQASLFD